MSNVVNTGSSESCSLIDHLLSERFSSFKTCLLVFLNFSLKRLENLVGLLFNANCVAFGVMFVEIGDVVCLGGKIEMLDRNMMVMRVVVVNMLVTWSLVNSGWSGDVSEWCFDKFVDWLFSYDDWGVVKWLWCVIKGLWCMVDRFMMLDDWDCLVDNFLNWVVGHIWICIKGESLS